MKTSTLLKSCLVLALLWLFILGPGLWARVRILRHVAGYHRTEMIVTATNCIGGQTRRLPPPGRAETGLLLSRLRRPKSALTPGPSPSSPHPSPGEGRKAQNSCF